MKRPYNYKLTYDWSGNCLRGDHRGFRTRADGTIEHFVNNSFDGKDPLSVIRAEQDCYKIMKREYNSKSVKKIVIKITGDQAQERAKK